MSLRYATSADNVQGSFCLVTLSDLIAWKVQCFQPVPWQDGYVLVNFSKGSFVINSVLIADCLFNLKTTGAIVLFIMIWDCFWVVWFKKQIHCQLLPSSYNFCERILMFWLYLCLLTSTYIMVSGIVYTNWFIERIEITIHRLFQKKQFN